MSRKVGVVVGDTPGHFYPALAITQALKRRAETDVLFGPARGLAADLAARHGCRFQSVRSSAIARVGPLGVIAAGARSLAGIVQARRIIAAENIQLVMAFGGFASGAVVLAARSLGRGTVIHEANAIPGLANRLLAPVADRVFVSAWTSLTSLRSNRVSRVNRVVVTGWPVRDEINALASCERVAPQDSVVRLLVCSGSRGGAFFARAIPALAAALARMGYAVSVRHQASDVDCTALARVYAQHNVTAEVTSFVGDMADAYRWATCVVARPGAGTLAEIALAGVPSVLVPLPDAADRHQFENARLFAKTGAALNVTEDEWHDTSTPRMVAELLQADRWVRASNAARAIATPAAAEAAADACEALMDGRW